MKKIFKIMIFIFAAFVLTIQFTDNTYAWYLPSNNKTALAVGADYGDSSSIDNANNAHSTYKGMGLTSKKITSPTVSNLTNSHTNGTPYLQSGIIYLNGHASSTSMQFPNSIYITKQNYISGSSIGIGYYDNTKTALIEFAGCKTAQGDNNITKYAYDQGANISIGWTTDINRASFVNWNKRFNDKIGTKTTSVEAAANSASNHIYISNSVKNYKIYGAKTYNPWYWITGSSTTKASRNIESLEANEYIIERNKINADFKNMNNNLLKKTAASLIKEKISNLFNISNYRLEINGNDTIYLDCVLYVGDIRTNLGYTISIDNSGSIHLYDNMNKLTEEEAINHVLSHTKERKQINYTTIADKMLLESRKADINTSSEIIEKIKYFDFDLDKEFYIVNVKNTTIKGQSDINEYRYEI